MSDSPFGIVSSQPYGSPGGGPGTTLTPAVTSLSTPATSFQDVKNTLSPPPGGLLPQYQTAIDLINKQRDYYAGLGASAAQGLATKRGNAGSSTEQFGVQSAYNDANRTAMEQTASLLGQSAAGQTQLQGILGNLTSDEVASLRNMSLSQQQMALQQMLGQRGLDIAQQNIGASEDIANQQARNSLIGSIGNMVSPFLLPKLFGSSGVPGMGSGTAGGGGIFNVGGGNGFLGMGGSGTTASGVGYSGAGAPASSLFPGGVTAPGGTVGTGVGGGGMFGAGGSLFNTAGTSAMGAGDVLPGVAGWQLGTHQFGDNRYTNTGGIIGATAGSMFGPLGSAAGGFIGAGLGGLSNQEANQVSKHFGNTAGSVLRYTNPLTAIPDSISKVSNAAKKIFPF